MNEKKPKGSYKNGFVHREFVGYKIKTKEGFVTNDKWVTGSSLPLGYVNGKALTSFSVPNNKNPGERVD